MKFFYIIFLAAAFAAALAPFGFWDKFMEQPVLATISAALGLITGYISYGILKKIVKIIWRKLKK